MRERSLRDYNALLNNVDCPTMKINHIKKLETNNIKYFKFLKTQISWNIFKMNLFIWKKKQPSSL